MRRASSSICMNLIEGAHRVSKNEYKHFVSISKGSCGEIKYQLLLSITTVKNSWKHAWNLYLRQITKIMK